MGKCLKPTATNHNFHLQPQTTISISSPATITSDHLTVWQVQAYQVVKDDFLLLSYGLWSKDIVHTDLCGGATAECLRLGLDFEEAITRRVKAL